MFNQIETQGIVTKSLVDDYVTIFGTPTSPLGFRLQLFQKISHTPSPSSWILFKQGNIVRHVVKRVSQLIFGCDGFLVQRFTYILSHVI